MDETVAQDPEVSLSIGTNYVNAYGDHFFSNLNFSSFNKASASDLFEKAFAKELFLINTLYVIVGTDSGLLPHYIGHKGIPEGTRYIFIEPKSILTELRTTTVLDGLDERIAFADEENWLDALTHFKMAEYFYIGGVKSSSAYCAQDNAMDAYAELNWYVTERLWQLYYQTSISVASEQFMIQQIRNLADNQHSAIRLKNVFKGKTALVLGGGPSLDAVLPWVLEHRSQIAVLAVSRIVRRLVQVGIEPDFIFSVDPSPANFDISKDMLSLSNKPVFIYSFHTYYELVNQWAGRALYLDQRVPWQSTLNETNLSSAGPTVSNTAIMAAYQLGFSRIYIAGVDFCFTLDGFTHAKGSNEFAAGARFNLTGSELETYEGTMAPSSLDFLFAKNVLQQQVSRVDAANCQIFNTALSAAKINNINYAPLSSIVLDEEPIDMESLLSQHLDDGDSSSYFSDALKEVERVQFQLKEIKDIAEQALKCNEEMYNSSGIIENYKDKRRLDKLEQKLKRKYRHFSRLVKSFGLRNFLKMLRPFDDDSWTADEVKWRLRVYYESYISGATRLGELLSQAESNLIERAEECKETPDWDLIINHCRLEKCFGRVRIWRQLKSAQQLPAKYEAVFSEFEQVFAEDLKSERAQHSKTVKKFTDLSILKNRAKSLFKHKKSDLLHHILLALDKHSEPEQVIPYRYLIQGYLAELENNLETALNNYQQVIEHAEGPIEEALLRIVDLDAQGDTAHAALECLTQLNPRYFVFYAESCRIRGNILDALEAYAAYLEVFPEDWIVQLKIAQLYFEQHIYDGVELMLHHILEIKPDQKTALMLKEQLRGIITQGT